MSEYVCINTKEIDRALELLNVKNYRLSTLLWKYDLIVENIDRNWEGKAAAAFVKDAKGIRTHLGDMTELLKMLNDVVAECREVIDACDKGLGEFNRDPQTE